MTINIGGQQFTEAQVIAAIAASDNDNHTHTLGAGATLEELNGVMQAVLHRLASLEEWLPERRQGFGVTTTTENGTTTYRVQTLDRQGKTVVVTFEVPE